MKYNLCLCLAFAISLNAFATDSPDDCQSRSRELETRQAETGRTAHALTPF